MKTLLTIYTILLLLALSSCAKKYNKTVYIDSEFSSIVTDYVNTANQYKVKVYIDDLIVKFDEQAMLRQDEMGRCILGLDTTPTVVISKDYWNSFTSDFDKRELLFHELSHCLLLKKHDNTQTIMNTYHQGHQIYNESTYETYDKQLFTMY